MSIYLIVNEANDKVYAAAVGRVTVHNIFREVNALPGEHVAELVAQETSRQEWLDWAQIQKPKDDEYIPRHRADVNEQAYLALKKLQKEG